MMSQVASRRLRAAQRVRITSRVTYYLPLLVISLLALSLRLIVWRWHEQYGLGGDEQEYWNQALTLLQQHHYVELKLMCPPLYTAFLAASMYLFDSLVQRVRLVQAIISAITVVPMYALTYQLFKKRHVALVAALLVAFSYTLAANATELLTETLFLCGLTIFFWLLLKAGEPQIDNPDRTIGARWSALAGLTLGALALLRSVALPLLPLGALWLLFSHNPRPVIRDLRSGIKRSGVLKACALVVCTLLVILPWTARNYVTYGAPILVDTTGPENLWLDNDPAGREAVKKQLYALGDDRAARQSVALQRGITSIIANPAWFVTKAWQQTRLFFALEYFDYMRDHRVIWVSQLEVWLRLLFGDLLWLVLLLGGVGGIWLAPGPTSHRRDAKDTSDVVSEETISTWLDPRWVFVPWALYTFLTGVIFHVELRYRLPLYPVLIPYSAWLLVQIGQYRIVTSSNRSIASSQRPVLAALTVAVLIGITLLNRPYISEGWMLAQKHVYLWQAERALASGKVVDARDAAQAALHSDPDSALARVDLARATLIEGNQQAALQSLDAAQSVLPDHPYAHLLRGAILRAQGQTKAARAELAHETDSLEDLQSWSWQTFTRIARPAPMVDVGGGLDLGFVRGFWPANEDNARWSQATSQIMLDAPVPVTRLDLRLNAHRLPGAPLPTVVVVIDGRELGQLRPTNTWQTYSLPISLAGGPVVVTLRSDTFRPRDYDKTSPDGRILGVMVSRVELVTQ